MDCSQLQIDTIGRISADFISLLNMFLDEKVFEIKTSSMHPSLCSSLQKTTKNKTLFVVTYDKLETSLSKSESPEDLMFSYRHTHNIVSRYVGFFLGTLEIVVSRACFP